MTKLGDDPNTQLRWRRHMRSSTNILTRLTNKPQDPPATEQCCSTLWDRKQKRKRMKTKMRKLFRQLVEQKYIQILRAIFATRKGTSHQTAQIRPTQATYHF
eukprot:5065267-Ditylum_brightwellii.AAC.1